MELQCLGVDVGWSGPRTLQQNGREGKQRVPSGPMAPHLPAAGYWSIRPEHCRSWQATAFSAGLPRTVSAANAPKSEPGNYRIRGRLTAFSWDFVRRYKTVCNAHAFVVS